MQGFAQAGRQIIKCDAGDERDRALAVDDDWPRESEFSRLYRGQSLLAHCADKRCAGSGIPAGDLHRYGVARGFALRRDRKREAHIIGTGEQGLIHGGLQLPGQT